MPHSGWLDGATRTLYLSERGLYMEARRNVVAVASSKRSEIIRRDGS